MRGLIKDKKAIKAYLQDNMKAGMCWDGEWLKRIIYKVMILKAQLVELVLKEGMGE